MGFHVEINSILRTDADQSLARGGEYTFEKSGSRVFFDDIPIWLTTSLWEARAEIRITRQTRSAEGVRGTFRVLHLYEGTEQTALTAIFRRMYAGGGDPFIYLLMTPADHARAVAEGTWDPPSRQHEGFIHASPAGQLARVANKYYGDHAELRVVALRTERLTAELRWEPATGGLYPHVYGPINMDAAERVSTVSRSIHGSFEFDPRS